jgi:uncharacterized protein
MTRIGLLSDTHGYLDPKILDYFKACDEIWHAGDIGNLQVADALEKFKPLRAVYGNIDDVALQARYGEDCFFTCEDLNIWMTHIGGTPPNYNPRVKKILKQHPPDIFICGHSHILRIKRDPNLRNMLFLNPGAAGNQGFHSIKTIIRFTVNQSKIENMEAIELGKRGEIK